MREAISNKSDIGGMMFDPGLEIGQTIRNSELVSIFGCGNMGGMRRSHATNTLVIVSDYTKGLYHDKWIGGVLHYTGMGKRGDMDIHFAQNATLAESGQNGVDVHLFEVIDPGVYIYCGRVALVEKPYKEIQPDEDGNSRQVWMFPVRPVPDNDVVKPAFFVFQDMKDYQTRGKNVDKEYAEILASQTKKRASMSDKNRSGLKGKKIKHKIYGDGLITKFDGMIMTVKFSEVGIKTLNYQICVDRDLVEFR